MLAVMAASTIAPPPIPVLELVDLGRVDARTAALLVDGAGRGEVAGAATWALAAGDDVALAVRIVVEVAGQELLAGTPEGPVPIGVAAYVLDEHGALTRFLSRGAMLEGAGRETMAAVGLRWVDRVVLDPGRYSIRVMVRNYRTDAAFLDRLEVIVPSPSESVAVLLPPVVTPAPGGWLAVLSAGEEEVVGPDAHRSPAARPVLANGEPVSLLIAAPGAESTVTLRARLVDPAGRVVAEPALTAAPDPVTRPPYRPYRLEAFDVPSGAYRLVLRAPGDEAQPEMAASLEVLISAAGLEVPWPVADLDPGTPPVSAGEESLAAARLRRLYREALGELARGDELEARRLLAALEREVALSSSARALTRLGRAEQGQAATLLRVDPAALRPLLWLHRDMSRYYRARHESALAAHAWTMTSELAELANAGGDDDSRRFAADVLTELAGELALVPAMQTATRVLRRALQLEPTHVDALVALGACLEQQSDVNGAVQAFRRAVELEPARQEPLLRLAVNLVRTDRRGAAEEIFRRLVAGDGPTWVGKVAVQQLALLLVDRGSAAEAVELLETALGRFGPDPRLTIQLAFALDAAGQGRRSTEVLAGLRPGAGEERSARYRYGEWPRLGPRVDHQRLASHAAGGRAALAGALGVVAPDEPS